MAVRRALWKTLLTVCLFLFVVSVVTHRNLLVVEANEDIFTYEMFQKMLSESGNSIKYEAMLNLSDQDYELWKEGKITVKDSVENGVGLHEDLNGDGVLDRYIPVKGQTSRSILILYGKLDGGWQKDSGRTLLATNDTGEYLTDKEALRLSYHETEYHLYMAEMKARRNSKPR